jgi:hypothetical protein
VSEQRRWNINLSFGERLIVLSALQQQMAKLSAFVIECEQLQARPFPTDDPEMWRSQLNDSEALYRRLSSAESSASGDPNGR